MRTNGSPPFKGGTYAGPYAFLIALVLVVGGMMDGNTLVAVLVISTAATIVGIAFALAWRYRAKL